MAPPDESDDLDAVPASGKGSEPDESAEDRALAALRAIASGADPAKEAFDLANRFTDDMTSRLTDFLRTLFRRPR